MVCAEAIAWRRGIVTLSAVALLASCSTGAPPPAAAVGSGPGASTPTPPPAGKHTSAAEAWSTGAGFLASTPDAVTPFVCPPGGRAGTVWGAGPYTADSSICTAAVHAGVITFEKGGSVTVRRSGPQPVYGASAAHGMTTSTYGAYAHSFLFQLADGTLAPAQGTATPLLWNSSVGMARTPGGRFSFWCPPAGTAGTIWGTDAYTLDSAPCTAGAHTGTISLERGGTVTVEVRTGAPAYTGSLRHGVQSSDYGKHDFAFVVLGA